MNYCEESKSEFIICFNVAVNTVHTGESNESELIWLDRQVAHVPALFVWLEHRREVERRGDEPELRESLDNLRQTHVWQDLKRRGFRRTLQDADRETYRAAAMVLYNSDALNELDTEVFIQDSISPEWEKIRQESRRAYGLE